MPFLKAAPTAAGSGVLSNENRMALERCLSAVIGDTGRLQTFGQEILGVRHDKRKTFLLQIGQFLASKSEPTAKG